MRYYKMVWAFIAMVSLFMPGLTEPVVLYGQEKNTIGTSEKGSEFAPHAVNSLFLDITRAGDAGRMITAGERGHIFSSSDMGATFQQIEVPTRATLSALFFIDEYHGWAVGNDAVILATDNSGKIWTHQFIAIEKGQPLLDVTFRDKKFGVAVGAYGLYLETQDGGNTWTEKYFESLDDEEYGLPHFNTVVFHKDGRMFMAGEAGFIARSFTSGKSWERIKSPYRGSFFSLLITEKGTIIVAGLRGSIYRASGRGTDFSKIPSNTLSLINKGIQLPDGKIIFVCNDGVILTSIDDGKSYEIIQQPERLSNMSVTYSENGKVLIVGEGGIRYISS